MSNNQKISFWNLIKKQKIVIPIIQRDYAQGREGKEYLRQGFLKELKDALDQDGKSLTLDFIYGTVNNNQAMSPLDGQQRLTTLWLLHWYIAYKTKKLESETVKSTLKKFSYETRVSSREFCEKLCELPYQKDNGDDNQKLSLLEYIQQQTWFYSVWNQDPTIQAMLRMLCGTKINDPKTDNDIADGIDELFGECTDGELSNYWTKLTCEESKECPISFYQMTIGTNELPLSDDLYIKMNARGKQLTSFENFKADLIDWMNKEENNDLFGEGENDQDEQRVEYASLIDNGWTDVFWKSSEEKPVDEMFFAFINRYFLNAAIIQDKQEGDLKWNLYGKESDDSKLAYQSFGIYKSILEKDKTILQRIEKLFENIKDNNEIRNYLPEWFNKEKKFGFIPTYKAENNGYQTTTLTQPQRVLFYAVCRYFEECKFDDTTFRHWMRIACNLIENPNINTIDAMIGRMKLIDELSKHLEKSDIYDFLNGITEPIESDAAKEQMDEEIKKVRQIMGRNGGTGEDKIIEAENYAFFHGAIRFLFTDENGNVNWSQFDTKFENAKKYFDEKGVHDDYKFLLTRALISQCESWDNQIYEKQIFDTSADNWKKILLSNQYKTPIHNCLIADDLNKLGKKDINNFQGIIDILINEETFTQEIIKKYEKFRFRWNHNYLSLYAPYGRDVITFDANDNKRNEFLTSLANIEIKRVVDNVNLFWGWDIIFSYNNYDFQWNTNGYIYLMENGRWKSKNETATEETEKYYCFQVDKLEKDDLKSKLDDLINQIPTI